jgi:hypothetical protein
MALNAVELPMLIRPMRAAKMVPTTSPLIGIVVLALT